MGKATGLAATLYLVLALPLPFVGKFIKEKYAPKKLIVTGALGIFTWDCSFWPVQPNLALFSFL
jgi:hypothetical protein